MSAMAGSKLYKEKIIDHYKNPRNNREIPDADYQAKVANSVCGDEVTMYLKEEGGKITEVGFKGTGCAISLAGASMLTEEITGKSIEEIENFDSEYMLNLLGMEKKSPRIRCAVLGLEAVMRALKDGEDDPCDFC